MPDFGPLSPILAALASAIITALVTYYVVAQRRAVTFWISKSDDLTLPLRKHHRHIVFKIGDVEMLNLNRAFVSVKNRGNVAIKDFAFDIEVPGQHENVWLETTIKDDKLKHALKSVPVKKNDPDRSELAVSAEFLNPREVLSFVVFFDNTTDDCNVHCRLENTRVRTKSGLYRSFSQELEEGGSARIVGAVASGAIGLFLAAALLKWGPSWLFVRPK
jgi:hypothetical protein